MDWELLHIFKIVPSADTKWPLKLFWLIWLEITTPTWFCTPFAYNIISTLHFLSLCLQQWGEFLADSKELDLFLSVIKNLLIWMLRLLTFRVNKRCILTLPSSILEICWLTELIISLPVLILILLFIFPEILWLWISFVLLCVYLLDIICNTSLIVLSFLSLHLSRKVFCFFPLFLKNSY